MKFYQISDFLSKLKTRIFFVKNCRSTWSQSFWSMRFYPLYSLTDKKCYTWIIMIILSQYTLAYTGHFFESSFFYQSKKNVLSIYFFFCSVYRNKWDRIYCHFIMNNFSYVLDSWNWSFSLHKLNKYWFFFHFKYSYLLFHLKRLVTWKYRFKKRRILLVTWVAIFSGSRHIIQSLGCFF